MRTRFLTTEAKEVEYYRDIRIHADTGMHEQAFDLVVKYATRGGSVLDVGAGAGALAQRLADAGFRVTGLDVDPLKWIPKDIPFLQLDLDKGVRSGVSGTFDMICCLEVIEHVEKSVELAPRFARSTQRRRTLDHFDPERHVLPFSCLVPPEGHSSLI
jgi:2-polyprenyl-3-methyl-5-hydroxy-6-metoxy-1,4-benzoquinol methylase